MPKVLTICSRTRDYEVHIVDDCAQAIGIQKDTGAFLVIDQDLPDSHKIIRLFSQDRVIYFKAHENTKTLSGCTRLIREMMQRNIRRNNIIFAVGGGVIEDTAAFVSMITFRGIEWIFCPTTLLAQADSCIGSKSSINFGAYKNLLGSFYPPSKVLIDVGFLKSLPAQQVKSGIGEILHFYLVAAKEALARRMMSRYDEFLKDPLELKQYILASLRIKKTVIERDEFDQGERNLFNYGHTFGHAIESVTHYRVNHGQAVTMGMDLADYLSLRLGHIDRAMFYRMHKILESNLPEFRLTTQKAGAYFQALSKDKKNVGNTLGCILTRGPGKMFKAQLPFDDHLREMVMSYFITI